MSQAYGIKALLPVDAAHILGIATARTGSTDLLLDIWNGPSSASRIFGVQKDGNLWAGLGAAATPAYTFEDDTDTGLFRKAANSLGFAAGGAETGYISGSGLSWGGGGAIADSDALPLLASANTFTNLNTFSRASDTYSIASKVTGDSVERFALKAGGVLEWGSGAAARDTNLYRASANKLKTDDAFEVAGVLTALSTLTVTGALQANGGLAVTGTATVGGNDIWHEGNMGAGSGLNADKVDTYEASYLLDAGNATGTLADARLSSNVPLKDAANTFSAINTFQSTVKLVHASDVQIWLDNTGLSDQFRLRNNAGWLYIDFAETADFATYTSRLSIGANGQVKLQGAENIVAGSTSDKVGFYGSSGAVKQTVTGSKAGNAALASLLTALAALGLLTDSSS